MVEELNADWTDTSQTVLKTFRTAAQQEIRNMKQKIALSSRWGKYGETAKYETEEEETANYETEGGFSHVLSSRCERTTPPRPCTNVSRTQLSKQKRVPKSHM